MAKKKLTAKQNKFIDEYMVDLNGRAAAKRAGYSKKSASVIACENLTKPYMKAAIEKKKQALAEACGITVKEVVDGLREVADRCLQKKKAEDGQPADKFEPSGANKAYELLGRHLGIFEKDNVQSKPEVVIVKYGKK